VAGLGGELVLLEVSFDLIQHGLERIQTFALDVSVDFGRHANGTRDVRLRDSEGHTTKSHGMRWSSAGEQDPKVISNLMN